MSPALQRKREIPRSKERFEKGETNNEGSNAIPIRKHWSTAIICSKAPSFGAEEPDPGGICRDHTLTEAGDASRWERGIYPAAACVCAWRSRGENADARVWRCSPLPALLCRAELIRESSRPEILLKTLELPASAAARQSQLFYFVWYYYSSTYLMPRVAWLWFIGGLGIQDIGTIVQYCA